MNKMNCVGCGNPVARNSDGSTIHISRHGAPLGLGCKTSKNTPIDIEEDTTILAQILGALRKIHKENIDA